MSHGGHDSQGTDQASVEGYTSGERMADTGTVERAGARGGEARTHQAA